MRRFVGSPALVSKLIGEAYIDLCVVIAAIGLNNIGFLSVHAGMANMLNDSKISLMCVSRRVSFYLHANSK